jgi:hypothetical protein
MPKMHSLATDYPVALLAPREPPCLTLYQPTHRHHPANQQDPIRFRNLLKELEASIERSYDSESVESLMEPFRALARDEGFWNRSLDGLAVLGAADLFRAYRLHRPVPERVVVADTFHTKPLMRIAQSADRYHVLSLTRGEARLFEGNRDALAEVELTEGFPRTLTDALGDELTDPHLTVASYGTGARGPAMHHGHGSRKDELEVDTERFFRAVDRALLEHYPGSEPLVLAALPENEAVFRQVSRNPQVVDTGINVSADAVSLDALRERSWQALEPSYLKRLAALVDAYGHGRPRGTASDDLSDVAAAAAAGRVGTLLIEADRVVPGRIDRSTGRITFADLSEPDVDDLLDEVAEVVLRHGGEVVVVPRERMPTETGIAAIHRF